MPERILTTKIPFHVFAGGGTLRGVVLLPEVDDLFPREGVVLLPEADDLLPEMAKLEWKGSASYHWGRLPPEVEDLLQAMGVDASRPLPLNSPLFGEEKRTSTDGCSLDDAPDDPAGAALRRLEEWGPVIEALSRLVSPKTLAEVRREYSLRVEMEARALAHLLA